VTAPPVPWWRQVPAWAMAAAAGIVLLLGATGSVIAQSMMPERVVARETPTNVVATPVVASPDLTAARVRLAALEEQIADMGARVERVSNRTVSVKTVEGDHSAMVTQLQKDFKAQLGIIASLREKLASYETDVYDRQTKLEQRVSDLTELVKTQILVK
jgi:TolA-binding protein